ncbi:type II 3-dehydroquinate dehydratase [Micromonosporaceae bacterium B7E4]|jgi:3-dehydroquinate dehydratase-2
MADRLFIVNGPNLNMLGRREPDIYGRTTLDDIRARCHEVAGQLGFDLFFGQSNFEGEIVEWVHRAYDESAAVIINPAGLTTRSVALYDALRMIRRPVLEVHLTNIFAREATYHSELVTARAATGFVAGFGADGYELAMHALKELARDTT